MRLNQKGQSFSTFKLLISAIIAISILTFLLQIFGIIDFSFGNKPVDAAGDVLGNAINNETSAYTTDKVIFDKSNNIVTARTLSKDVTIDSSNICVILGYYYDNENLFEQMDKGAGIRYLGTGQQQAKISAICGADNDELKLAVGDYKTSKPNNLFEDIDNSDDSCDLETAQPACIIVLRSSSA